MKFRETSLHGLVVIEPEPNHDERGFFVRVLSAELFAAAGIDSNAFVQENQSRSRHRTLRGLHVRTSPCEAKTVRCASGEIFDVVVDLRPWSPSFLQSEHFVLDDKRHLQLFIPPGCAHGFQVLSDTCDVCYRHTQFYQPGLDVAVAWDDPELAIPWPLDDPILSERDRTAPRVAEVRDQLDSWFADIQPFL